MALGSVSISTFIPGELEDLTGTVSIIPFTRAEIERLANKKAYPDGKLVYTGATSFTYKSDGLLTLPDEVDYVKLTCQSCSSYTPDYAVPNGTKLARGSSIKPGGAGISFSSEGLLKFVGYNSVYKPYGASYIVEGYHYY